MIEKKEHLALIDMDGTVADFDGAMKADLESLRSPGEDPTLDEQAYEDIPHIQARRRLIKLTPGFWRNLKPIKLGFEVVDVLRVVGFEMHVLTKGPIRTPSAWEEKVEWVKQHLPDTPITITMKKQLVYGRALVDDWAPYFEPWLEVRPRGLVVAVAQPWNKDYAPGGVKEHPRVVRYDGTNHEELLRKLVEARDR